MANYVLSEELRRAVVQVINQHQSSFQPRPKRGRRARNSGAFEFPAAPSSVFAVVVTAAGPSIKTSTSLGENSDIGECIIRSGYYFHPIVEDEEDLSQINDYKIEFRSLHSVGCPKGSLIRLHCDRDITNGVRSYWPETHQEWLAGSDAQQRRKRAVWGELFRSPDELVGLPGAGTQTILWLPDGASAEVMRWDGGEC